MRKSAIYILIFATFIIQSCKEAITVDIPQASDKVVVEGYISTETDSSYVLLTKTISYYSTGPIPIIPNAFVKVNNTDTFFHIGNGMYKPHSPYYGQKNKTYNLSVIYNGTEYTATSVLNPLILIDTTQFSLLYHDKSLIAPAGYSISFNFQFANDNQYTYFRDGFKNDSLSHGQDSIYSQIVTFDSKNSKYNYWQPFDIPLLRLQPNDTALLLFRSCDLNAFNVYNAIGSNSQGGTPFSNPPANLPNNIRGGAIGMFAAQEVRHFRIRIKP